MDEKNVVKEMAKAAIDEDFNVSYSGPVEEASGGSGNLFGKILKIGGGLALVGGAAFLYFKNKKKKNDQLLEDDYEDEDFDDDFFEDDLDVPAVAKDSETETSDKSEK